MKKRKIRKALKRLKYLPKGKYFITYLSNKVINTLYRIFRSTKVAYPSTLMFEVINLCNLHCITCPREYRYGKEMDTGHMDITLFKNLMDQAYPYIDSVGLTGLGEPLLYKHLAEALQYIKFKNKGIITSISTNALLPKIIPKVKEIKENIDTVQISIDGIGETYNKIRLKGDYNLFIENVKGIKEVLANSDTDITLNMVVIKENYHQMSDMIDLTHNMGFSDISFTLFNLVAVTDIDIDYYDFFYSKEFIDQLRKAHLKAKTYPNIDVSFWDFRTQNGFKKCPFPWTHFFISWDGYLPPCCAKPFPKELSFGNFNEKSLIKCLNSKEFRDFRRLWFKNSTPDFCKKCHFTDLKPVLIER